MNLSVISSLSKVLGQSTPSENLTKDLSDILANGTDMDEANQYWADLRTLAKNAAENLDLSGSVTNAFGDSVALTKLVAIVFHNRSTTPADNLLIGGGATNFLLFKSATGRYELGPNGLFMVWEPSLAGKTVTATTADLLRVENQGTQAISYDVILIGRQ